MLKRVCLALWLLPLAACGGGSTPTAPTPVKVVLRGGTFSAGSHTATFVDFQAPTSGQLTITVSWLDPANPIFVDVSASCTTTQFVAGVCQFQFSDRSSPVAAKKTASGVSVAAGFYTLILSNLGPVSETVTYEVDLTS